MPTPDLNLTDEQICVTFPRLVQYDGMDFYDGLGNLIPRPINQASLFVTSEILTGIKDAQNLIFTTNQNFTVGTTKLFRNGLRLTPGIDNDYSEIGTNKISFYRPPYPTDNLLIDYEKY